MAYRGRILSVIGVILLGFSFNLYYYFNFGHVEWSWHKIVMFLIVVTISWFTGKQYDKAKYFSEKDVLTGIYNRRFVESFFLKIKSMTERNDQMFAVLVVDVNNFKMINDALGHKEGDKVLKVISNELEESVRDTDIVARWGGDEFIILSPDIKKKENAGDIINRIHHNLGNISFNNIEISVSIGASIYPNEGKTFDELLSIADKNMYDMKITTKED